MARTRDRRPSAEVEERRFPAQMNGYENHRVYEANEISAAEALMGINASPTTSHPNEARSASASISSNTTPPYLISRSQRQETTVEKSQSHRRSSATPSTSSKNRKRNRGKSSTATSYEELKHVEYTANSVQHSSKAEGLHGEFALGQQHSRSNSAHSQPNASAWQVPSNALEQEQQVHSDNNHIEQREDRQRASSKSRRKRKRSSSVSVAAISRGQVDEPESLPEVNKEEHVVHEEGLVSPPTRTQSEQQTPAPPATPQVPVQQTQNEVGGPANPDTETAVNGVNGRKSKLRNFDRVVFGRWLIKTWYYSPYPISNVEDDGTSASMGPSKQGATATGPRGRQSKGSSARRAQNPHEDRSPAEESMLWVCDKCFKYMVEGSLFELHSRFCREMHPPGRKVYERGAHVIYEIDGARHKLYCQNLSLFGKLFIDIKTLFYDCENFMFYVLTEGDRQQDHVIGFFSKEKVSYDEYNLACIITFPPYQRKRYGMLMIEFSYYLSRREGKLGTPERPLSELGLRTYLTYWTGALVQFLRRILSVQPFTDISRDRQRTPDDDLIRFIEAREANGSRKRRKSGKAINDNATKAIIWEKGLENEYNTSDAVAATSGANDILYNRMRYMRVSANPDGSATIHVFAKCTLQDIANATGIRPEDVAFTLHECGLLQRIQALDREETEEVLVISREMVEKVAQEYKVKNKMCMEVQYCLA